MRGALALSLLMLGGLAFLPGLGEAGHDCDPYPIGRCGDYQRESVVFCYLAGKPLGTYIDVTERTNVVSIGSAGVSIPGLGALTTNDLLAPLGLPVSPGGSDVAGVRGYVNMTPLLTFAANPLGAPLPTKSVFQESNGSPGLQLFKHRCANFVWFAECEPAQWMFFNPSAVLDPDAKVA